MYLQSTTVYVPFVGIGILPTPLSPASVPIPPEPKGGGHTRLWVRGLGSPSFDDWSKSLALCLLCGLYMACKPKNTTTTLHENHYHLEDVALVQSRPALARPLAPP